MRNYRFYKEDNCWYIDLPEYIESGVGDQADLQMVAGADVWLEIQAKGKSEVFMNFETEPFVGFTVAFDRIPTLDGAICTSGAFYKTYEEKPMTIWLCDVTKWLFKEFPTRIFCRVINPPTVYESRSTTKTNRS